MKSDSNSRTEQLLNSLVGCAFVTLLDESGLSPGDVADPATALRAVAGSADFVDKYDADYDVISRWVKELARGKADLAGELFEHLATAWWFEDVDLEAQAWLSIHGTLDKFTYGIPPNPSEWRRPQDPSRPWERYAQKPLGNQSTSTLYAPFLTSELVAREERVGDYRCEFPLAWWSMRILEDVRVFEIHGPSDWHELCVRYPAKGREDDRLVPNWGAIAEEWDGVHLSLGGLLTTEQNRFESAAGWSMLDSWHAEQTFWLGSIDVEVERQPDFNRGMGPPLTYELKMPRFPTESGRMLVRE